MPRTFRGFINSQGEATLDRPPSSQSTRSSQRAVASGCGSTTPVRQSKSRKQATSPPAASTTTSTASSSSSKRSRSSPSPAAAAVDAEADDLELSPIKRPKSAARGRKRQLASPSDDDDDQPVSGRASSSSTSVSPSSSRRSNRLSQAAEDEPARPPRAAAAGQRRKKAAAAAAEIPVFVDEIVSHSDDGIEELDALIIPPHRPGSPQPTDRHALQAVSANTLQAQQRDQRKQVKGKASKATEQPQRAQSTISFQSRKPLASRQSVRPTTKRAEPTTAQKATRSVTGTTQAQCFKDPIAQDRRKVIRNAVQKNVKHAFELLDTDLTEPSTAATSSSTSSSSGQQTYGRTAKSKQQLASSKPKDPKLEHFGHWEVEDARKFYAEIDATPLEELVEIEEVVLI